MMVLSSSRDRVNSIESKSSRRSSIDSTHSTTSEFVDEDDVMDFMTRDQFFYSDEPPLSLDMIDLDEAVLTKLIQDVQSLKSGHWEAEEKTVLLRKLVAGASWDLNSYDGEESDFSEIKKISALIR
eukprot:Awhi_evm1s8398